MRTRSIQTCRLERIFMDTVLSGKLLLAGSNSQKEICKVVTPKNK